MFVMPEGLEVQERPERISKMAFYLLDKEPLIYLFIINSDFIPDPDGKILGEFYAGVIFQKDRVKFFYKPDIINTISRQELYFIIVHEAFHIFKKHMERHEKLDDPIIRNIAEDAVINHEIKTASFVGAFIPKLIDGVIHVPKRFLSEYYTLGNDAIETHRIYYWMKKKQEEQLKNFLFNIGRYVKIKNEKDENKQFGKIVDYGKDSLHKKIEQMSKKELFDELFKGKKQKNSKEEKEEKIKNMIPVVTGNDINQGIAPRKNGIQITGFDFHYENGRDEKEKEEAEVEKNFFIDKIINQAEEIEKTLNVDKTAGKGAGSLISKIKELNKPKINWKKEFGKKMNVFLSKNSFLHQPIKSYINYPWNPRSRYGILGKFPIMQKKNLQTYIIFAIDTSGSVFYSEEDMSKFFTEVDAASKQLEFTNKGHVLVMQWDYEVEEELRIYKAGDWKGFDFKGGGGTNPKCIFEYLDKTFMEKGNRYVVDTKEVKFATEDKKRLPFLCILTDGYFYSHLNNKSLGIYEKNEDNILYFTRNISNIYPKENYIKYQ